MKYENPSSPFGDPPHRPRWMSRQDYQRLLERDGPIFRCAACVREGLLFDRADLSIDHIVARHEGGGNDLTNLQILCRMCNSAKGANPDRYWRDDFYFDLMPNLAGMRRANRDLFRRIVDVYPDWFARPRTDIAGVLHTLGWIVAAGKTLAIPTVAWAINRATRELTRGAAVPRIDRVLVLTKESGLRDQIAGDLERDIVKYEIAARAPKVRIVRAWDDLAPIRDGYPGDIFVSTIQMFFQDRTNEPKFEFAQRLAKFGLIVFDEPHWALDQVRAVMRSAHSSICFGTTGSPIDATGTLLPSMALVSAFGYDEAVQHDQSLKLLTGDLDAHLRTAVIQQADLLDLPSITRPDESPDYSRNLHAKISVILDAIRHLRACDNAMQRCRLGGGVRAEHRPPDAIPDLLYPVHAVVKVESREDGRYLKSWLEQWLERNRADFPTEDGYRVDFVVTEDPEHPERGPANPLSPNHPWFATWRKFQQDVVGWDHLPADNACRILLVLGMGREGSNNPMCGVTVFGHEITSRVTGVQLFVGRQLRGLQYTDATGVLHVPPAIADTVRLLNHEAFARNRRVLQDCIDFLLHMPEELENLRSLDDLIAELNPHQPQQAADDKPTDPNDDQRDVLPPPEVLTFGQRLRIMSDLGGGYAADLIIGDLFPQADQEAQRAQAHEWVREVSLEPDRAVRRLRLDVQLHPVEIVTREYPSHHAGLDELRDHLRWNHPDLFVAFGADLDQDNNRVWAERLREMWRRQFQPGPLPSTTTLEEIRRDLARRILASTDTLGLGEEHQRRVRQLVALAVQRVLGATERVGKDTRWERPEVHVRLLREDVQMNIRSWVIARLTKEGLLVNLQHTIGAFIPADEEAAADDFWWIPGAEGNGDDGGEA